jgi:hypothetical protein
MKTKEFRKYKVYRLHNEQKMSYRQISEIMGISLGTIHADLSHIPANYVAADQSDVSKLAEKCKGLPFFCGADHIVGQCDKCFWGIIKEPLDMHNQPTICYDYELEIINAIETYHAVSLIKSRSIGATQLMVIYFLYRIFAKQDKGNFFIICGNDMEASKGIMRRLRVILSKHDIFTDDKETVLNFPQLDSRIQCYPSRVASLRSWDRVQIAFADEVDSLENSQDIRSVLEAYKVKSGADIVLCSTPGRINSTMHRIMKEPIDKCFYHRLSIDYTRSLGKLLNQKDIEHLKESSPSFESEFCCKFGFTKVGNMLSSKALDDAITRSYSIEETTANANSPKSMGIDYGQTGTGGLGGGMGAVITAYEDGIVKVLEARLWTNAEYNEVLQDIRTMIQTYDPVKVWVDGSAVSFCRSIKLIPEIDEDPNYQAVIKMYNEMKGVDWTNNMRVIPINWVRHQVGMINNLQMLFNQNAIAVSPTLDKLVTALRTAVTENMRLVKDLSQYNDLTDSLFLACLEYEVSKN